MRNLFIGFLLIFLDFNLNLNSITIGLIPDFIGYIFMIKGLDELSGEAGSFARIRPFAVGMGIYSAVLYALDLFGISVQLGIIGVLMGVAGLVISLYIAYVIIKGVQELEALHSASLESEKLRSTWTVMAVGQAAAYLTIFLPVLAIICILVCFVAAIVFLVAFNTSKKLYEALLKTKGPELEF